MYKDEICEENRSRKIVSTRRKQTAITHVSFSPLQQNKDFQTSL